MAGDLGSARGKVLIETAQGVRNIRTLQGELRNLGKTGSAAVDGLGSKIKKNAAGIQAVGGVLTAVGLGVVGSFGLMVNTGADFEQQMDGVAASLGGVGTSAGVTKAQFQALTDEALRVGSTTSKSANEAAGAMDLMAKAGINVETIVNGGAQAVVNLSEATSESIDQSASSLSSLFLLFEDTGISVTQMADSIVTGMNNSDASLSEFQTGLARLAPAIKGGSLSFAEASASIAYFNQQGFSAAEVGTSLSSIFQSVSAPTDDMAAALDEAGIKAFDLQGNFVGFPALFDQVAAATAGMTEEQKANFLSTAFMTDGVDLLSAATGTTKDELEALEAEIAKSGSAAEASATRMDNFRGDMEQLGGAFETLSIRVGSIFLPIMRQVTQVAAAVVNAISGLPTPILAVVSALGAAGGAAALLSGGLLLALPRIVETRKALQAFGGTRAILTKMTAAVRAFSASILLNPVVLIAVAAALAAIVAYKTNFLGFRDAVQAVIGAFRTFASAVQAAWNAIGSTTNNPVSRALSALSAGFRSLDLGWANRIADAISGVSEKVEDFVGAFQDAWDSFSKVTTSTQKAVGWYTTFSTTVETVTSTVNGLSRILYSLGAAFDAIGLETIGNVFTSLGSVVQVAVESFRQFRAQGIDPLTAALRTVMAVFPALSGVIQPVITAIDAIKAKWQELTAAITLFRTLGANPLQAVLGALSLAFPVLAKAINHVLKAIDAFAEAWDAVMDAANAFLDGDFSKGFKALGKAAKKALDGVLEMATALYQSMGDIAELIEDGIGRAFDWAERKAGVFGDTVRRVGAILSGIVGVVANIMQAIAALLNGDVGGFFRELGQAAQDAFQVVLNAATLIPQLLIDTFQAIPWTDLWQGITKAWDAIPWGDMASAAIGLLGDGLRAAASGLGDLWGWITDSVGNIDWGAVGNALVSGLQSALGSIGDLAGSIASKIGDIASAVRTWIGDHLPTADDWLGLAANAVDIAGDIVGKFGTLLTEIQTWITSNVPQLSDWLGLAANAGRLALKAVQKFGNLGSYVVAWLRDAVPDLSDWLSLITDAIGLAGKVIDYAGTLADKIKNWITGAVPDASVWLDLIGGAARLALNALKKFGDLGGYVVSWITDAVPTLADWLSILSNIGDGIATSVVTAFGSLKDAVTDWIDDAFKQLGDIVNVVIGWLPDAGDIKDGILAAFQPVKDAFNTIKGWFGFGDDGGESVSADQLINIDIADVARQVEQALADTFDKMKGDVLGPALARFIDAAMHVAFATALDTDDVTIGQKLVTSLESSAKTALEGAENAAGIASAIRTWVSNGITTAGEDLSTTVAGIREAIDTAVTADMAKLSGESLASALRAWVGRAVTQASASMGGEQGLAFARGIDTAFGAGFGALSGESLGTAIWLWESKAQGLAIAKIASTNGIAFARGVNSAVTDGFGALSGASLGNSISDWFDRAVSAATSAVESSATALGDDAGTGLGTGLRDQIGAWKAILDNYVAAVRNRTGAMRDAGDEVGDAGASGLNTALRNGLDTVRFIADQYVAALGNREGAMRSSGFRVGAAGGAGVAAGLRSYLREVRHAAAEIIYEVDRAMRKAGEIRSPSKLTTWIGEMLGQGPIEGIASKVRDAVKAARTFMDAVLAAFDRQAPALAFANLPIGARMPADLSRYVTGTEGGRATTIVNNISYRLDFGGIHQQPGESGEELAARIERRVTETIFGSEKTTASVMDGV